MHEGAILHGHGRQLAGAHAQKRVRWLVVGDVRHLPVVAGTMRFDYDGVRRKQKPLPGMRSDRVAEPGIVVAALQPVTAARLFVGPSARQIVDRADLVIDDRLLRNGGAYDVVALSPEQIKQFLEIGFRQHQGLAGICFF